ncbi:hypothetical protein Rcae01_00636 [Novipirellula caenicola]|uniref:Uncharacterized protein n=1 Tax=Novipirellula caenicola TaxID=1536901 RepID=A0ABP9VKR9_9BACT
MGFLGIYEGTSAITNAYFYCELAVFRTAAIQVAAQITCAHTDTFLGIRFPITNHCVTATGNAIVIFSDGNECGYPIVR